MFVLNFSSGFAAAFFLSLPVSVCVCIKMLTYFFVFVLCYALVCFISFFVVAILT